MLFHMYKWERGKKRRTRAGITCRDEPKAQEKVARRVRRCRPKEIRWRRHKKFWNKNKSDHHSFIFFFFFISLSTQHKVSNHFMCRLACGWHRLRFSTSVGQEIKNKKENRDKISSIIEINLNFFFLFLPLPECALNVWPKSHAPRIPVHSKFCGSSSARGGG